MGWARWIAVALCVAHAATAGSATPAAPSLLAFSAEEHAAIAAHGPWPPPPARDAANRHQQRPAAVAFGRQLFFDPRLSPDGRFACATCHAPAKAFTDGLPVAPARGGGQRNTPGLLDVAQQRWFGWDGANDSLWAASLAPMLAPSEMSQSPQTLAHTLRTTPTLAAGYARAFGQPPGRDDVQVVVNIAKALAAYQATLTSPRTAFDAFRDALGRGDTAAASRYPLDAQRGLKLFIGTGRCNLCHSSPRFSNGEFADAGVPFFLRGIPGVDSGRHGGIERLQGSARANRLGPHNDAGAADPRAVTTQHVVVQHRNFGEFRVPGLRQLVHTAPYMHNGSLASIEDVVRHYSRLNEDRLHVDGERILRPLNLTVAEESDLAAFLRSLSR